MDRRADSGRKRALSDLLCGPRKARRFDTGGLAPRSECRGLVPSGLRRWCPRWHEPSPQFWDRLDPGGQPNVAGMTHQVQHIAAGEGVELAAPDAVLTVKI